MGAVKVGEDHAIGIVAVGVPAPAPDEVIVSPVCCGICGTDLHIVRHGFPGTRYPVIPGHEFAGHVTAVGADVRDIKEGDFVAVDPNVTCGTCRWCRARRPNLCLALSPIGVARPGAFADFVAVPARNAYRVPESIGHSVAALIEPLACVLNAVAASGGVKDRSVLVMGAGTMGLLLAVVCRRLGATVTVCDPAVGRHAVARKAGIENVAMPDGLGSELFEVVFEAAGVAPALLAGVERLGDGHARPGRGPQRGGPGRPAAVPHLREGAAHRRLELAGGQVSGGGRVHARHPHRGVDPRHRHVRRLGLRGGRGQHGEGHVREDAPDLLRPLRMTDLCCGLDIGSTNLKAVLVDAAGRVRWARAVPTPRIDDGVGPATSADELLRAAEDLVMEGWTAVGGGKPLRAIATAGVGEDGLPLGSDLAPAAPSIPWFDERAVAEAEELAASKAASARLGLRPDRFRTVAKWLWLSRHRPQDLADGPTWVALTDFPAVAWSGRSFMSETLASRTAAYDVYSRRWHTPMLGAATAPKLPEVLPAGTVVGTVRPGRLRSAGAAGPGTLVVAGGHDHPVAASFIRRFEPDAVVDSMGTAEVVYGETDAGLVRELDPRLAFCVPVLGGPGLACLGVYELASALASLRAGPHGDLVAALLSNVSADAGTDGSGAEGASKLDPERQAALDEAEGALQGAIARSASLIEAVGATGDIYTTGGWSRSDRFLQMRADAFGRTIHRFGEDELTGAGAGLIAWGAIAPTRVSAPARPPVRSFTPATADRRRPGGGHDRRTI